MNSIYKIGKSVTMIIVAHRLSTLRGCDEIIEIDMGAIIRLNNLMNW